MEQSKYYTPDIKELRVGFEYEYSGNKGKDWDIGIIESLYDFEDLIDDLRYDDIRVKYLDRLDIEEVGFTYLEDQGMSENNGYRFTIPDNTFFRSFYHLFYWKTNNRLKIERPFMGCIFDGIIKNKSELKELLEKIGIK